MSHASARLCFPIALTLLLAGCKPEVVSDITGVGISPTGSVAEAAKDVPSQEGVAAAAPPNVTTPSDKQPADGTSQVSEGEAEAAGQIAEPEKSPPSFSGEPSEPSNGTPASAEAPGESPQQGKANHLINETSPYLLQHAHNLVDWHPWGKEALDKAVQEKKLIFLSVGYSSCHWCHVMERESFMDPAIAKALNEHFVCIKVDREERPDIDEVYMTSLQIYYQLVGSPQSGGWPLSMFLTPQAEPLVGGTYFPPSDFQKTIEVISTQWNENSDNLAKLGKKMAEAVSEAMRDRANNSAPRVDGHLADSTLRALRDVFDATYGGFGFSELDANRPKFPEPQNLFFLLQRAESQPADEDVRKMLQTTLSQMAAGGMWDHLGGGFHRYSTDRYWRVPHFEKMLYDNGQLASIYAKASVVFNDPLYAQIAKEIARFMIRELRDSEGGFHSALDAESDGVEGRYYVWSAEELQRSLSPEELTALRKHFGLSEQPNFEDKYFLFTRSHAIESAESQAIENTEEPGHLMALQSALDKLWQLRQKRIAPMVDNKILTSWNGLAICGLADVGRLLKDEESLAAAEQAAQFSLRFLRSEDGRLARNITQGKVNAFAFLDDYAYLIQGLLSVHAATGKKQYLQAAVELQEMQQKLFWDSERGGYFFTPVDGETVLVRGKNLTDGPMPSGNAVSVSNLVTLHRLKKNPKYLQWAEQILKNASSKLEKNPVALPAMAMGLQEYLGALEETSSNPSSSDKDARGPAVKKEPAPKGTK